MRKSKPRLGALLVESLAQAAAIDRGEARAPRRHRRTIRDTVVTPPPHYGSSRIRRFRERLGLSQPVFAQALNVSVATVRGWEQGARTPDGPSRRLLEIAEQHPSSILGAVKAGRRPLSTAA
jgi:putative transcriptional regulator